MAGKVYIYSGRRSQAREIVERAEAAGVGVKILHDPGFFDSRFPALCLVCLLVTFVFTCFFTEGKALPSGSPQPRCRQ